MCGHYIISLESRDWDIKYEDILCIAREVFDSIFKDIRTEIPNGRPIVIDWSSKWGEPGPVTRYFEDKIVICTTFEGPYDNGQIDWGKFVYELGHEFGHILMNSDRLPNKSFAWFEETICEAFSRHSLMKLSELEEKFTSAQGIWGGIFSSYHNQVINHDLLNAAKFASRGLSEYVNSRREILSNWDNRYDLYYHSEIESAITPLLLQRNMRESLPKIYSSHINSSIDLLLRQWISLLKDSNEARILCQTLGISITTNIN